jgi:hypothetical protein
MVSNGINIGLKSYDDLFKDDIGRRTEEIKPTPITELKPFSEQPFKVIDDETRVLVFTPYGQRYEELCEAVL